MLCEHFKTSTIHKIRAQICARHLHGRFNSVWPDGRFAGPVYFRAPETAKKKINSMLNLFANLFVLLSSSCVVWRQVCRFAKTVWCSVSRANARFVFRFGANHRLRSMAIGRCVYVFWVRKLFVDRFVGRERRKTLFHILLMNMAINWSLHHPRSTLTVCLTRSVIHTPNKLCLPETLAGEDTRQTMIGIWYPPFKSKLRRKTEWNLFLISRHPLNILTGWRLNSSLKSSESDIQTLKFKPQTVFTLTEVLD